jgi:hypothetical protein
MGMLVLPLLVVSTGNGAPQVDDSAAWSIAFV